MTTSVEAPLIELDGVIKRFGRTVAVDGLSLTVGRGELVGLLGANGAGKTTTVKLLLGLTRPSAGTGRILGAALGNRTARGRIGYLPELFRYQPWLRGREVLALHAELAGVSPVRRRGAASDVLQLVGLSDRAEDRVANYSKGMQQRLGLAAALVGDPELVLLDEPTSALDPVGRADVRDILRRARDRGTTVILNSHLLTEVERICDRIVIMDRGRIVASGPLDAIVPGDGLRVRVTGLDAEAKERLNRFAPMQDDGEWLTFRPLEPARIPDIVAAMVTAGGRVHAVEPGGGSLEQRFLELVAGGRAPT